MDTKKTTHVDLKKIIFKGIDDQPLNEDTQTHLRQQIANVLFNGARTVPVHEASKALYKGESVELEENSWQEAKEILQNNPFKLFVQIPLNEFLNQLN